MYCIKRLLLITVIVIVLPSLAMSQDRFGTGEREMTPEESYLQQTIEIINIESLFLRSRLLTGMDRREMELQALDYINEAIENGNTSPKIREVLEEISRQGVTSVTRENGRIVNNNPEARRRAAEYLGKIGTPEATNALIDIVNYDNETMVITKAIESLGIIGINEIGHNGTGKTVEYISWTVDRYNNLNPDNYLALSALEAFERIAEVNGRIDRVARETTLKIWQGNYITPVKERALLTYDRLMRYPQ